MIGFIGSGNMASAIIRGMLHSGVEACDVGVYDIDGKKTAALSDEIGIRAFSSTNELISSCDTVVLAVKPNVFPDLLPAIREKLEKYDPLVISIAAGKTLEYITSLLCYTPKLVRIMPNINAKVCEAISAYCANDRVSKNELQTVETFCSCFGKGIEIREELFPIYSAIAGCSPAYAYMFIDSMARAAVKNGMPKKQALEISAQAVMGSAKMILESGTHPWQLVDEVCSPGGTTIEGVASLQNDGFEAAVIKAVEASYNKDKKI